MAIPIRFPGPGEVVDWAAPRHQGFVFRRDLPPGEAEWIEDDEGVATHLAFACPCACGRVQILPVFLGDVGYGWQWINGRERPTLSPAIHSPPPLGCGWNGYLIQGRFLDA